MDVATSNHADRMDFPISVSRFMELTGLSPTTVWRLRQKGWLRTINISGRQYVMRSEMDCFANRAKAGDFAQEIARPKSRRNCPANRANR